MGLLILSLLSQSAQASYLTHHRHGVKLILQPNLWYKSSEFHLQFTL